jgi:hypothetical protein
MPTISELVTDIWPTTEGILTENVTSYSDAKTRAITKAKKRLYGDTTIPSDESDIPNIAKYWIANMTVIQLIPIATDYYSVKRRTSDSKEGANISYYDLVATLNQLRQELRAECNELHDDAADAIDTEDAPDQNDESPAVSTKGLLLRPTERAWNRGSF